MSQNNSNDQEIDLNQVFQKFNQIINKIFDTFFDGILFIKKKFLVLLVLLIVGGTLGHFLSKASKSYEQKIIVHPNFGSIEYLYNKIELVNAKLEDKDEAFFKQIGINNYKQLGLISIQPIIDIYKFTSVEKEATNLEVIKLLADNKNVENVIKDKVTSKNFKKHIIEFTTKTPVGENEFIEPLMSYFNNSDYYSKLAVLAKEKSLRMLQANDSIINQIDNILDVYTKGNIQNSTKVVSLEEKNYINDLIEQKIKLLEDKTSLQIDLINEENVIKEISTTTDILEITTSNRNYKYILPIIFVILFILFRGFISFYNKQMQKRNLA